MPTYCFTNPDCGTLEFVYGLDECPEQVCVEGLVYERDIASEQGARMSVRCTNWPMKSDALGVHESQIGEATEEARRCGVPTEFTKDGRAILTSAKHRKAYAEMYGMYDRNGGYGDPQRK